MSEDMKMLVDQACEIYCQDIARIDVLGPNRRIIFTVPAAVSSGYHSVTVKLIVPAELMTKLACMAIGVEQTTAKSLIALDPTITVAN